MSSTSAQKSEFPHRKINIALLSSVVASSVLASWASAYAQPGSTLDRALADLLFVATQNLSAAVSFAYLIALLVSTIAGYKMLSYFLTPAMLSLSAFVFLSAGPWQELLSVPDRRLTPLQSREEVQVILASVGQNPNPIRTISTLLPKEVHLDLAPSPAPMLDRRELLRMAGRPASAGPPLPPYANNYHERDFPNLMSSPPLLDYAATLQLGQPFNMSLVFPSPSPSPRPQRKQ
jgi:hypothetical protein